MATWKKVIVSGSVAELATVSASIGLIVGSNQQITTTQATTFLTGSFTGSFKGDGTNLTGVTATAIFPTSAVSNITSTDKFFISQSSNQYITYGDLLTDLAGTNLVVEGTDSLSLASQIVVTGVTASFTGSLVGALTGTASLATNATNVAITDTTTGTGPYYIAFTDGTTGNRAVRVDSSALTFNATTNTLTVTSSYAIQALTASYALNIPATASYASQALSSSYASTASYVVTAQTASYVLQAVSASFASTASYVVLAQTASYVVTAQTASYVLNAVSSSFGATSSFIANAVTNNTNNYILTATGGGNINGEGNLTFDGTLLTVNGNTTITGDLTVAGTASFTNTDNLSIKDKFILINSGSTVLADSGWITQYNAAGSGSAFYLEATSTGTYGRFAVAYDAIGTSTAIVPDEYVVTARVSASAAIPANPTWGGSGNGSGNMFINSLTGDIYIYS
jgi:hypothetical protein